MNLTKNILVSAMVFILSATVFGQSAKLKIGIIDNTNGNSCGTNLTFAGSPGGKEVFLSNEDGSRIRIDGKIINFKFIKTTQKRGKSPKKGDKYIETYSTKSFKMTISYTVTGFEDDTIRYKAVLTVIKEKSARTVNLIGWSGC